MKTIEEVTNYVEDLLNIELSSKVSMKNKTDELAFARSIVYYICKNYLKISYNKIGKHFGKTHATILHSQKKTLEQIKNIRIYADAISKADAVFETLSQMEDQDSHVKEHLNIRDSEYELIKVKAKNKELEKELSILREYINEIPSNKALVDYFKRIPKSRRALAEEKVLNAARLVYNG